MGINYWKLLGFVNYLGCGARYGSTANRKVRDLFALFASITVIRGMFEHISSAGHVSYWHWAQLITSHPTMNA